ncbi:MAG: SusD/RagB family nutrient-binding outer membrane lipoprotein [Chitinophagaceae bacterium]|nr:SusD/RagB family nutrient-binding outer membrane lipoprotein [Chitinophagaceae bacterium]
MFTRAESGACMNQGYYQTVQNLYADLYAQYFALNTTSFQTDRYVMNDGWLPRLGVVTYVFAVPQLKTIMDNTDSLSGESALANIMWVYAFHHLTDYFGPVAYLKAGEPISSIPYDSQETIYRDFFKRLDAAVKVLKSSSQSNVFGNSDIIYGGDITKWIAFANTLKLRLALRVSNVLPDLAKQEAESAVASGVMTDVNQSAWILKTLNGSDGNGLTRIASFHEFSMSSTMASYLKGYSDPRLSVYYQPTITDGNFRSIRNGTPATDLTNPFNSGANTSNVGTYWVQWVNGAWVPNLTAKQPVMYAAEAYFLRAEGALNGWNMGGAAQDLYEQGIKTSLKEWKITDPVIVNNYIQSTATPAAPGDFYNSPAVSTAPVLWSSDENVEREQIGIQKWLATYPDGMEGWASFRRSGYPKMYPVIETDNTDLPQGTFIQRLPYPSSERITNSAELDKGIQLLGGPDKVSTPLWWAK